MYKIKSVEIKDFWGSRHLQTDIDEDITIFIGDNGSGKSTLINILQGILNLELELLIRHEFTYSNIVLQNPENELSIVVRRESSEDYFETLIYEIGSENYRIPMVTAENIRRMAIGSKHRETITEVKEMLSELVNTSWLSVNRSRNDSNEEEINRVKMRKSFYAISNSVDLRLSYLLDKTSQYLLKLQTEANRLSNNFQSAILGLVLYNKEFDTIDLEEEGDIDFEGLHEQLIRTYEEVLGKINKPLEEKIEKHIKKIEESVYKIKNRDDDLTVNDIMPISLYKRTMRIADLSKKNDIQKKSLFEDMELFIEIVNDFLSKKRIEISKGNRVGISVFKKNEEIDIFKLSSGEKQLLILFLETLLQEHESFVYIADEPELSLHISWQSKLLKSIRRLNDNAQIIVATHSPEIAGNYKKNIIQMETILK